MLSTIPVCFQTNAIDPIFRPKFAQYITSTHISPWTRVLVHQVKNASESSPDARSLGWLGFVHPGGVYDPFNY